MADSVALPQIAKSNRPQHPAASPRGGGLRGLPLKDLCMQQLRNNGTKLIV